MLGYLIQRLLGALSVLFVVSIVAFGLYALTPGDAYLYNEGDLHSPRREGSTRLIRIEGRNVEKIRRLAYEAV